MSRESATRSDLRWIDSERTEGRIDNNARASLEKEYSECRGQYGCTERLPANLGDITGAQLMEQTCRESELSTRIDGYTNVSSAKPDLKHVLSFGVASISQ